MRFVDARVGQWGAILAVVYALSGASAVEAVCVLARAVEGNPTCGSLGIGNGSLKADPPREQGYPADEPIVHITDIRDDKELDWTSTIGVEGVIVKGGPAANLYLCDPASTAASGFIAPTNPGGQQPDLSHVTFCFGDEPPPCEGVVCEDDGNECTDDFCDAATGACVNPPADGRECETGSVCDTDGVCSDGECMGTPVDCDDGDDCTVDSCDEEGGCASLAIDCDDGDNCTTDSCDGEGGCANLPVDLDPQFAVGDARAYGTSITLLDRELLSPSPDSDEENPYLAFELPLGPLGHVALFEGSETSSGDASSHSSSATARAANVVLLDPGLGIGTPLLGADTIRVVSSSQANAFGAGSSAECVIENAVVLGRRLGTVTEPVEIPIELPLLGVTITVNLCEEIATGAAAGLPQPDDTGTTGSGLTVNAIHVNILGGERLERAIGSRTLDLVVSHAESSAAIGYVCQVPPHVSGEAFVLGVSVDETLLDPENQLVNGKVAHVLLPASGGEESASLANVGPIRSGLNTLAASNAAFSHTEGEVSGSSTSSASHAQVEDLTLLAAPPFGTLLEAELVRAECTADHDGEEGSVTAATTILGARLGARLGGRDLCDALDLEPLCVPEPNTEIDLDLVRIRLNEQIDGSTSTHADVTVNAIHLFILGAGNPLGLPVGADVIVASAHCDAGGGAGEVEEPSVSEEGGATDPVGEVVAPAGRRGSSGLPLAGGLGKVGEALGGGEKGGGDPISSLLGSLLRSLGLGNLLGR